MQYIIFQEHEGVWYAIIMEEDGVWGYPRECPRTLGREIETRFSWAGSRKWVYDMWSREIREVGTDLLVWSVPIEFNHIL